MPALFPTLSRASSFGDAFVGLGMPVRALRLIFTTPRVFALSSLCAVVTAVTLVALVPFWWGRSNEWAQWLIGADARWQRYASALAAVLIFVVTYAVSALTVPNLVLAPLTDPLSEATETAGGAKSPPGGGVLRGVIESLTHTLLRFVLMAVGFAVLWPINLVPGVGSVVWLVASTVWSMFWLAVEQVSNPAARHLVPFGQVVRALRRRPFLSLGFGASLWVVLWLPVVNFFLLPLAIVAGTLLFQSLEVNQAFTRPSGTAAHLP